MNKSYIIRTYQDGDENGIVELLDEVFDGWPKFDLNCSPLEHWKWKHRDNPLGKSIIMIAESNDKIIGCTHEIPIRLKIGDNIYYSSFGGDDAVHPDFRGLGIWKKMSLPSTKEFFMKSNIKVNYSVTENPILVKHRKQSSYVMIFPRDIIYYYRVGDIKLHMKMINKENKYVYSLGLRCLKTLNRYRNFYKNHRFSSPKKDFDVSVVQSFDNRIYDFWSEINNYYDFIVEKKNDFLNWRYLDPRAGDYFIKVAHDDKGILGYIVLRINKYLREYPSGYIVDLLTLPARIDVAHALVVDAIKYFENQDVNIIKYQNIKNHIYEELFFSFQFIKSKNRPFFSFDLYPKENEDLLKFKKSQSKKMHFSFGDYDPI